MGNFRGMADAPNRCINVVHIGWIDHSCVNGTSMLQVSNWIVMSSNQCSRRNCVYTDAPSSLFFCSAPYKANDRMLRR